jgi:hypothetical protein
MWTVRINEFVKCSNTLGCSVPVVFSYSQVHKLLRTPENSGDANLLTLTVRFGGATRTRFCSDGRPEARPKAVSPGFHAQEALTATRDAERRS